MKQTIPATELAYYSDNGASQNLTKMRSIYQSHKAIIDNISKITRVDAKIILSVIMCESSGKATAVSSCNACGLMQLKPTTAHDVIVLENMKKRLLPEEEAILVKYLGQSKVNCLKGQKYLSQKMLCNNMTGSGLISKADLFNPELNILIGAIALGIRIDQESEGNKCRLEKALLRYNRGYFYKPKGNNFNETLNSLTKNSESYKYLLKMMGRNGLISVLM